MQVFVLIADLGYDGEMFLGVYATMFEAVNAYNEYVKMNQHIRCFVMERVLGAPAEYTYDNHQYL